MSEGGNLQLDFPTFRSLVGSSLAPMLGATVETNSRPSNPREQCVAWGDPCRLLFKLERAWNQRVVISRSQAFVQEERELAETFVTVVSEIATVQSDEFRQELLSTVSRRVVARIVSDAPALPRILKQLDKWATDTYEGARITAAVGVNPGGAPNQPIVPIEQLWEQSFCPVLSNGHDTLVVCSRDGGVVGFEQLDLGQNSMHAPYRLSQLANWAADGRIVVALNRHGEVLIFSDKRLRFARRSGRWAHFMHDVVLMRMDPPRDAALRRAVYESCLDVSFARTGGCIGVVSRDKTGNLSRYVGSGDILTRQTSIKSRLFSATINRPFQDLDRRLRQELLAMDGATILDYRGTIMAVGAIINVPGGSTGGGRRAAAERLGQEGLGIKISQDGSVTGFRNGQEVFFL